MPTCKHPCVQLFFFYTFFSANIDTEFGVGPYGQTNIVIKNDSLKLIMILVQISEFLTLTTVIKAFKIVSREQTF